MPAASVSRTVYCTDWAENNGWGSAGPVYLGPDAGASTGVGDETFANVPEIISSKTNVVLVEPELLIDGFIVAADEPNVREITNDSSAPFGAPNAILIRGVLSLVVPLIPPETGG